MKGALGAMIRRHAQTGKIEEILLRPDRRAPCVSVERAHLGPAGLDGDHARAGKRALTLIQAEHLPVVASLLGQPAITASDLRRNLVISGINILGLRHQTVRLGTAEILVHGPCPPCSRMEETLGAGGYSALRGHGGVYCEVLTAGNIGVGDPVQLRED